MALFRKPATRTETHTKRGFVLTTSCLHRNPLHCTVKIVDPAGEVLVEVGGEEDEIIDLAIKTAQEKNPECPRAIEFYWA